MSNILILKTSHPKGCVSGIFSSPAFFIRSPFLTAITVPIQLAKPANAVVAGPVALYCYKPETFSCTSPLDMAVRHVILLCAMRGFAWHNYSAFCYIFY